MDIYGRHGWLGINLPDLASFGWLGEVSYRRAFLCFVPFKTHMCAYIGTPMK